MTPTPTTIQLAWPWTGPDGKEHEANDVVEVDVDTARDLLAAGRARVPDPTNTPTSTETTEPATSAGQAATAPESPAPKTKQKGV